MAEATGVNSEFASMMPSLSDDANIQEAIQKYHYGNSSYQDLSFSPNFTSFGGGIVGKLSWLKTEVTNLNTNAISKTLIDAAGDLIIGSAADTVTRLGKGTNGQVLRINAGSVVWESLDSSYLPLIGGSLSGSLTATATSVSISSVATTTTGSLIVGAADGQTRNLLFNVGASSSRWEIGSTGAQSGDRTGQDLTIKSYNNSGITPVTAITITRASTPAITLSGTLTVTGTSSLQTTTVLSPTSGGTFAARNISFGTGTPSGGANGDLYIQY